MHGARASVMLERATEIARELSRVDPAMERVVADSRVDWPRFVKPPFVALAGCIVGQMVPYARARTIRTRLYERLGGTAFGPDALATVLADRAVRREVGLNVRAARALQALCDHARSRGAPITADDVRRIGREVPGVGRWTIEAALVTALLDADAFPADDRWLRRKMGALYGLARIPTAAEAERLSRKWSPYRAFAAAYLWRWFDARESRALSST